MDKDLVLKKLNTAFAPKGGANKSDYVHPHEGAILRSALSVLKETETGSKLVKFLESSSIKVRIVPDQVETGFIPNGNLAYITAPRDTELATPRVVLNLVRALREAQQEEMGYKRPNPSLPKQEFIKQDLVKEEDILVHLCAIAYELSQNSGLQDVIDEMSIMGYKDIMQGYIKDLETV